MTLQIGFQPWGETIDELVDAATAAEAAGASTIFVSELHRSATIVAAAVAAATSTARIATGVVLAFTRSPVVTALESLDLAELSRGRFVLGLGTGTKRVNEEWHHRDFDRPAPRLGEVIRGIRAFWEGSTTDGAIEVDGEFEPMRIHGYRRPYATALPIPIYVAAVGPGMLRLAGRVGDGWLSHELCSPKFLAERVLPELEQGWERRGRPAAYDIVASLCCSVSGDRALARQRVLPHVAFYATVRTYADFFDFHGLGDEHRRIAEAFRETRKAPADVSDEMAGALTATGTPDEVEQRIREYDGLATSVKLSVPTQGLAPDEIRSAQREIIELIGRIV